GAIEYGVVLTTDPSSERVSSVPPTAPSVTFTSATEVADPPPSAKSGMTLVALEGAWVKSTTGIAVIKNSDRSLVDIRTAAALTGTEEANVNVPSIVVGAGENGVTMRNGASFRKREI